MDTDKTIEYVLEVARCGGISKAAANLFITPSALSKYIIQKEDELGVRIFNREGNKFTLTYPGERYIEMLRQLQDTRRRMALEMNRLADLYKGRLRVGFQMALAEPVTGRIVPAMRRQFPNIRIALEEGGADELRKLLRTNQLDVVLTLAEREEEDRELRYDPVVSSPLVIAAARNNPLRQQAVTREGFSHPWLSDEAILGQKLVLDKDERKFRRYAGYLLENTRMQRSEVVATNARTALLCASADLGIVAMPEILIRALHAEEQVALYSYGGEERHSELSVAYNEKTVLVSEISEFRRIVGTCFAQEEPKSDR